MELYRADHAMVGSRHLNTDVAAIMERFVTLGGQLADGPFSQVIVYRELAIRKEGEHAVPKTPQIIEGFRI